MKKYLASLVFVFLVSGVCWADTFGTGGNAFNIDFVPISGSTNPASGYGIVNNNYRMGTYEVSKPQWTKFEAAYGTVTGSPKEAYDKIPDWGFTDAPANNVSWYEAAQFVNYLNTITNHQVAYKFTGTKGTSGYTFGVWQSGDAGYSASNPYRNSNAYYFLPTEDEWVKAAYWNGTNLQTYATIGDTTPTQAGWNYYTGPSYPNGYGPWAFTSGSQELNGTYNMMGNVSDWMESPYNSGSYLSGSERGLCGGAWNVNVNYLASTNRNNGDPSYEYYDLGFRVASIPEPTTLLLLGLGGVMLRSRKL